MWLVSVIVVISFVYFIIISLNKNYDHMMFLSDKAEIFKTIEHVFVIIIASLIVFMILGIIYRKKTKESKMIFWSLFVLALVSLSLCTYVNVTIKKEFSTNISGDSMYPTYVDSEEITIFFKGEYEYGDVIVFTVSKEDNINILSVDNQYYIKRIIGLPGDHVELDDVNNLYVNGLLKKEMYLGVTYTNVSEFDGEFTYINEEGKIIESTIIPEGYVFVLGDNRNIGSSIDSRQIGLIKMEDIVGIVKQKGE